jgi:hypothetical protein
METGISELGCARVTARAKHGTVLSALATARVAQVASETGEIPALSRNGDAPARG